MKLVIKIALGIILAVIVMTAGCSALLASDPEVRKATAALEDVSAEPQKKSEPAAPAKSAETAGQDNARRSAESYLDTMAFSRKGLIEQLSSEYGAGFSKADAIYAVNHIDVDWNEQAAKSAKNYLDTMAFSRQGLIEQLESEYGAGFTHAQAVYGVNAAGL